MPLAAVHAPAMPPSFRRRAGGRGCLPCCGAACFPACLPQPQTRDTKREGRHGGGSAASLSLPPSSLLSQFPLLPSCFYISCLRLPSKGQRAFAFCVCVSVCLSVCVRAAGYIWLVHQTLGFPLEGPSQCPTSPAQVFDGRLHVHVDTQDAVSALHSHVILRCRIYIHRSISGTRCQDLDSLQSPQTFPEVRARRARACVAPVCSGSRLSDATVGSPEK